MSYNNLAIAFQRKLAAENGKRVNSAKIALLDEIRRCYPYETVDIDKLIELVNAYQSAQADLKANMDEIARLNRLEAQA